VAVTSVQPVRVPKTAELVAAHLRRQIVRGDLPEGDALPSESDLMKQFGVSRPTLREAFRVLEAESLITVRRGSRGGARVHAPDVQVAARYTGLLLQVQGVTIAEVYDARVIIEPPAARLLADRADPAAIVELEAVLEQEHRVLSDPAAHSLVALTFHERIVELAGNVTLAVLAGMLHEIIEGHIAAATRSSLAKRHGDGPARGAHRAHVRFVALLREGDGHRAEQFWRGHLEAARKPLLDEYGDRAIIDLYS